MNAIIIFIASYIYLLSVLFFGAYFFSLSRVARRRFFLISVFTFPLSYITGVLAGHLYYNPRPFVVLHITPLVQHAADNGFPSDHALLMGTIAAVVTVFNRRLGIGLWVLAILVGTARVMAAVHHPLDILAAFLIAIGATATVVFLLRGRGTEA